MHLSKFFFFLSKHSSSVLCRKMLLLRTSLYLINFARPSSSKYYYSCICSTTLQKYLTTVFKSPDEWSCHGCFGRETGFYRPGDWKYKSMVDQDITLWACFTENQTICLREGMWKYLIAQSRSKWLSFYLPFLFSSTSTCCWLYFGSDLFSVMHDHCRTNI